MSDIAGRVRVQIGSLTGFGRIGLDCVGLGCRASLDGKNGREGKG